MESNQILANLTHNGAQLGPTHNGAQSSLTWANLTHNIAQSGTICNGTHSSIGASSAQWRIDYCATAR
eukprot:4397835-Lingulodinium_polyedra.AAC.1